MSRLLLSPGWLAIKLSWGIAKDSFFTEYPPLNSHGTGKTIQSRKCFAHFFAPEVQALPGCLSCSSSALVTGDHLPPLRGQRDPDKTLGNHQQKFPQEIGLNKAVGRGHYMTPTTTWCTILRGEASQNCSNICIVWSPNLVIIHDLKIPDRGDDDRFWKSSQKHPPKVLRRWVAFKTLMTLRYPDWFVIGILQKNNKLGR